MVGEIEEERDWGGVKLHLETRRGGGLQRIEVGVLD